MWPCPQIVGTAVAARVAQRLWPAIVYADVFLTEDCNHRCSYCFVHGKRPTRMSEAVARDSLEWLLLASKEVQDVCILFFGGEPLLEPELIRFFVEYGRARFAEAGKKLRFDMTTNGTLMTEEMARYLRDNGIRYLLSIDGGQATHDAHRRMLGGGSSFQAVMERLPMMKRHQPWQGTRVTVHPDAVDRLHQNVDALFRRGINQFIIGVATGVAWTDDALKAYEEQMCLVADMYREMKERRLPFRMTLFEKDLEGADGHYHGVWGCGAGRGRICISAEGALYGCAKIVGLDAFEETHKLGDVWVGITALARRRDLLNIHPGPRPGCAACQHADDCAGGCPATNYEATGSIFQPAPLECALVPIVKRIKARVQLADDPDGRGAQSAPCSRHPQATCDEPR